MAISMLDNLSIKKMSPDVERQLFDDLDAMVAFDERYLADVYECNLKSDGSRWRFNRNNEVTTTGRWRKVEGAQIGNLEAKEEQDESYTTEVEIVEGTGEELECTKTVTTIGNEVTTIITANGDSSNSDVLKAGDIISIKKEIDGVVIYEYHFYENDNTIVSPFD